MRSNITALLFAPLFRCKGRLRKGLLAFYLVVWSWIPLISASPQTQEEQWAAQTSAAVQKVLGEADRLRRTKQGQDALKLAEQALRAAQIAHDEIGEAAAHRFRARTWQGLNRPAAAVAAWREAAAAWERVEDTPGRIEALASAGLLIAAWSEAEADALVAQAVALGRSESKRPLAVATVLTDLGNIYSWYYLVGSALQLIETGWRIRERLAPNALATAESLNSLGKVFWIQDDVPKALDYYRRALSIAEKSDPSSLMVATILNNLGEIAWKQGDEETAMAYHQRALARRQQSAPDSLSVAWSLNNLGLVKWKFGDLVAAKEYHEQARSIRERCVASAPEGLGSRPNLAAIDLAWSFHNLGLVASDQGDLMAARDYHRRALALREPHVPSYQNMAWSLANLGDIAYRQGDLEVSREYYHEALALFKKEVPDFLSVSVVLNRLGRIASLQGDGRAAREYLHQALAIAERKAPDGIVHAWILDNLGSMARQQRDLARARDYHQRALAVLEKRPTMDLAECLQNLGVLAQEQGNWEEAEHYHQQALALREAQAPNSLFVAASLFYLGEVSGTQGNLVKAEERARKAWRIVRERAADVTGDEARQAFGVSMSSYSTHLIRYQMALGQWKAAFVTLEESRAQALQQQLLERQIVVPEVDGSLWSTYRIAIAHRNRAEQRIAQASVEEALARRALAARREEGSAAEDLRKKQAALEAAIKRLEDAQSAYTLARMKADALWTEIKGRAPRSFVQPLTLEQAQKVLTSGTLFIAFAVGPEQTQVFLLASPDDTEPALSAYTIPMPQGKLQERVTQLQKAITSPLYSSPAQVAALSRPLFTQLFPPAARAAIAAASRLLLSPDGPLWEVSFAALVTNTQGRPRYLGDERAITYTPSLALFAQSLRQAPALASGQKPRALVVGNPVFTRKAVPTASIPPARARFRGERAYFFMAGAPPAPLPATRAEAIRIAQFYDSVALTEERATEAAVRQHMAAADVIHLATHGYFFPRRAMASGVLLTAPEPEPPPEETDNDGVLQAWEIYSQIKLKAELVVLSACEIGRGQTVPGEGLVGMTRALQYAGARAIVASRWKVSDRTTQTLMIELHRHLRRGLSKDAALQAAMRFVRERGKKAHPYYWAPFFLMGDPENPNLGTPPKRP